MLEFMNKRTFNGYYISARVGDCEPNLVCFNYITPMAICVETVLKATWIEYKNPKFVDEAEDIQLDSLLKDETFINWLGENYSIPKQIIERIDRDIRKEANKYKHSLLVLPLRSVEQKKSRFECFYQFLALYYKKKTGLEAPPWSDKAYYSLVCSNLEKEKRRVDIAYSGRGE